MTTATLGKDGIRVIFGGGGAIEFYVLDLGIGQIWNNRLLSVGVIGVMLIEIFNSVLHNYPQGRITRRVVFRVGLCFSAALVCTGAQTLPRWPHNCM